MKKQKTKKNKLPTFWQLLKQSFALIKIGYKPIIGVAIVYAALYFLLVLGLTVSYSFADLKNSTLQSLGDTGSELAKNMAIVVSLFGVGLSSNQSDATTLMQFLLFSISSLAMIWTLRHAAKNTKLKIRDAFYVGNAQIIPFILVTIMLLLCFVPAVIGSSIFGVAQMSGAAGLELFITGIIAGAALFLSLYWISAWLPAIYIVALPSTKPIAAIKSAAKLTKKHRFWILRNLAGFVILLVAMVLILMLPFVTILQFAAIAVVFVVMFLIFIIGHTYIFSLYKALINE